MRYEAKAVVVAMIVAVVTGGCARLKAGHSTTTEETVTPHRTGAAALYPNAQTPGATNPHVTQANIQTTICKDGWATAFRPPAKYLTALKQEQLVALGATVADPDGKCMPHSANAKCYEEDHVIPPELGGAPRDAKNLWPQPYKPVPGAKGKDWVEKYLHEQVCAGNMTLLGAQHVLVTDWYALYVAKHQERKSSPVAASSGSPTAGTSKPSAGQ
jgi:hypothetical protein